MNKDVIENFFKAYWKPGMYTVCTDKVPKEMMRSEINESGWFEWGLIKGNLTVKDYQKVEKDLNIQYPPSFIEWHRAYFFLDGDCSLVRLPESNPNELLHDLRSVDDLSASEQLIPMKIYPFADEGNDTGSLVFDAREPVESHEFPVRVYDHEYDGELEGLSNVIFSSFTKLLECITHFLELRAVKSDYKIIPDFFTIDPTGAGLAGRDYWNCWIEMLKAHENTS
ncbi:SMI1/KNR4 family protein [Tunicatimonas pelagia]|uniref:SMI1/KNR4 family protein n=1 Tax=Tunicatimonas pelagia TaxID=931531 RepID=UPI002664F5E7|nr:SMI1/KNR4 family protein [Tunicatimonas pelagia]WKN45577.1 SMI1/KNR4 family protein [Tunicatimonas pelagia]